MRVIVPYANLHELTVKALELWCPLEPEYIDVTRSNEAYFETLRDVWVDGEGFIIIEHDIEIREDTIENLVSCTHDWCAYPYAMGPGGYETALGCTKFSKDLVTSCPNVMHEAGEIVDPWSPRKDWRSIDRRIFVLLTQTYGYEEHRHEPHVRHHNPEKRVAVEIESDL